MWRIAKPRELRQVGGEFVVRHDAQPRAALDHRLAHVGPLREHQVDEIRGFLERVVIHLRRGDDRKAARADVFLVEVRSHQLRWRRGNITGESTAEGGKENWSNEAGAMHDRNEYECGQKL